MLIIKSILQNWSKKRFPVGAKYLSPCLKIENRIEAKNFSHEMMFEHLSPEIKDENDNWSKNVSPLSDENNNLPFRSPYITLYLRHNQYSPFFVLLYNLLFKTHKKVQTVL